MSEIHIYTFLIVVACFSTVALLWAITELAQAGINHIKRTHRFNARMKQLKEMGK